VLCELRLRHIFLFSCFGDLFADYLTVHACFVFVFSTSQNYIGDAGRHAKKQLLLVVFTLLLVVICLQRVVLGKERADSKAQTSKILRIPDLFRQKNRKLLHFGTQRRLSHISQPNQIRGLLIAIGIVLGASEPLHFTR
jgi:hypothetical protein